MNMNTNLKPGDLLYRSKGIFQHAGIYLGNSQVFHHSPDRGSEIVSLAVFSAGEPVRAIAITPQNWPESCETIRRVLKAGEGYDPIFSNCEHVVNLVLMGKWNSPQLQATVIAALATFWVCRSRGIRNSLLMSLLTGLIGCAFFNVLSNRYALIPTT